jgi:acyl-CoA reductase-like NAD-dependent aldehyde dehydrogenase
MVKAIDGMAAVFNRMAGKPGSPNAQVQQSYKMVAESVQDDEDYKTLMKYRDLMRKRRDDYKQLIAAKSNQASVKADGETLNVLHQSVIHCNMAYLRVADNSAAASIYDEYVATMEDFIRLLRTKGNAVRQYSFYKSGMRCTAENRNATVDEALTYKEALAIAHEMVEEAWLEIQRRKLQN